MVFGKRLKNEVCNIDFSKKYLLNEAVEIVKKCANAKFEESIDVACNLNVDPRHADQIVRGATVLPHGLGKKVTVLVFTNENNYSLAKDIGADIIADDDVIKKISDGFLDFDCCIATPDVMPKIAKLGKILGPRGLMPNPKLGTVTNDIGEAVKKAKAGQVMYKVEKNGILHLPIGRAGFSVDMLVENFIAFFKELLILKPSGVKNKFILDITLSSTMGVGIKLDIVNLNELVIQKG